MHPGFGWTNGMALIMLEQYGDVLDWTRMGAMDSPVEITGRVRRRHRCRSGESSDAARSFVLELLGLSIDIFDR